MLLAVMTSFLQGLGIVGLVAFSLEASLLLLTTERARMIVTAIVFSTGVVATMALPFVFGPGIHFDLRNLFLILAAPFGGLPAAVLTTAAAALFRVHMGGLGTAPGLVQIGMAAGIGILAFRFPRVLAGPLRGGALLGIAASLTVTSLFVLPFEIALNIAREFGVPYMAVNFVGLLVAYLILRRRTDAIAREAALSREAETDPLTGVYNRRAFNRLAPRLLDRAGVYGHPCSILLVHVEGVKTINDHLGRRARDLALVKAADLIAGSVPEVHILARIGSQEFAMLLLAQDTERAAQIAERIRVAVAAEDFHLGKGSARLMVSIGLKPTFGPGHRLEEVLAAVDEALHAAKQAGRNRVQIANAA